MEGYQDIRREEIFGRVHNPDPTPVRQAESPPESLPRLSAAVGHSVEIAEDDATGVSRDLLPDHPDPELLESRYAGLELHGSQSREPEAAEEIAEPMPQEEIMPELGRQDRVEIVPEGGEEASSISPALDAIPALQAAGSRPRYVGQIFDTYILCELDDSFVVVDQHAVQERLIFEKLSRQYEKKAVARQVLLFPDLVELAGDESQIVEQYGPEIERFGLEIKEFGGDSYMISAVPAPLGHLPPAEVLRGIIIQLSGDLEAAGSRPTRMANILAVMACKAAVKAGNSLQPQEAEALLEQMWQAGIFSHCPHGRPVARIISRDEVKKWFLRT